MSDEHDARRVPSDGTAGFATPMPIAPDGDGYRIELSGSTRQFFHLRLEPLGGLAHVESTLVRRTMQGIESRPMTFVMRDGDAMALCVCLARKYGLRLEPYLSEHPGPGRSDRAWREAARD